MFGADRRWYWLISRKKAKEQIVEGAVVEAEPATARPEGDREMVPSGSIADVSLRAGVDLRDLWMMGMPQGEESSYSQEALQNFLNGKLSLDELRSGKERPDAPAAPRPPAAPAPAPKPKSRAYSESDIKRLVEGLWADKDPNEPDFRDATMMAGAYRKECAKKLREIGKDAIPYLEVYAQRNEVASLLAELKEL